MNSNYPRAKEVEEKRSLNLIAGAFALAAFLHAFFGVFFPDNPGIEFLRYIPQSGRPAFSVGLWIAMIAWGIWTMWKSGPWKFWRKVRLTLLAGLFTTLSALLLDLPNRRGHWFYDGDFNLILFGSLAMGVIALILSTPVWITSGIVRRRNAKNLNQNLPLMLRADQESGLVQEHGREESVSAVVEQHA